MSGKPSTKTMLAAVYKPQALRWMACKVVGWVTPRVFWSRLANLRVEQVPVPALPTSEWVRLRPILGGICGTDVAAIMQREHPASILQAFSSFPAVLGHENVSVVEEIGAGVIGFKPGDRVVVESALSCRPRGIEPRCPSCKAGRFTLCENFRRGSLAPGSMIGWNNFTGGTWSSSFVAHQSQLYPVPDRVDDEVAVLTDPVAGALHAVLKRSPREGETVLIVGGGLLGVGIAACIRALGCRARPVALVRHRRQAELMKQYGVDEVLESGRKDGQSVRYRKVADFVDGQVYPTRFGHQAFVGGFDLVYDCVGSGQSLTDAMKYAREGGTVVEVGTSQIALVDTAPLWFDELTLIGSNGRAIESYEGQERHTYEIVFDLIAKGRLDLRGLLTHTFRLTQYKEAFETIVSRSRSGAVKVAFRPE